MQLVQGTGSDVQHNQPERKDAAVDPTGSLVGIHVDKLQSISEHVHDGKVFTVVVVDDSLLPRAAAKALLNASESFRLVGEASSGEQAMQLIPAAKPDLVLMDVHMPGMDGPATTRALRQASPDLKVVAWTVSDSSDDLVRMMGAGCSGYVLKDAGPTELSRALMAALRSENPVPRKMIPEVLRRVTQQPLTRPPTTVKLTSREMQILRGAAKGFTSKKLAAESGLKLPSVETHLRNIFRKLGASNRGEAVSTALKIGLITLSDL